MKKIAIVTGFVCFFTFAGTLVQSPVPFAFPNPAFLNDVGHVTLVVPAAAFVVKRVELYTAAGVYVRSLQSYHTHNAEKHYHWDGLDNEGIEVHSGVYIAYVVFDETERNTAFLFRVQR